MMIPGMPFQGDTLETASLGGSETAALCVARELAKLGHYVAVFSNTEKPGVYDDVKYLPASEWRARAIGSPHDVCIVQRAPEAFGQPTAAKLNLLWCHDLALMRAAVPFKSVLWNVDKVLVVSQYMAQQYKDVYGLPDELLWVTRNGIDLARFTGLDGRTRDRKALICAARPERGVDLLLRDIFPKLLERDPSLTLRLCGYDNTVAHMVDFYAQVDQLMANFGDRVVWLGHLTKRELYEQYASAGVYVYPTPSQTSPMFAEVSCLSAMEAMAAGLPIVTSHRGALPETIPADAGVLIDGDPWTAEYQRRFVDSVVALTTDDAVWQRASAAGTAKAQTLDWSGVAAEWSETFAWLINEHNDTPYRLAKHFYRRSDVIALRQVLPQIEDADQRQQLEAALRPWDFAGEQDTIREQYERIGSTHTDVFASAATEPRFHMVGKWLSDHGHLQRILDFGCAHGAYAVNLANRLGRTWVGVDIDRHGIEWAERFRTERATHLDAMTFLIGDQFADLSAQAPFDALLMMETLEHIPNPGEAIDALERWVTPGGKVFITVPYGPWEYMSYDSYPHRAHLWEYDMHDLRDLFGNKKGLQIGTVAFGMNRILGEPLGWHIVEYAVTPGRRCGTVDMARKLAVQRPRQTVSVSMIAGPGAEECLHWTLRSVKHVADEIVIGDTGMTDEGRRIAAQYGATIVPAPPPFEAGVEASRNATLPSCRMDWVLWIDTDEKLADPEHLHKYLRANIFNGYGMKQHHFACDTGYKPDLPVRLFRRVSADSRSMRWFGMIHEHPEFALNEGPGLTIVIADVHIPHLGYLTEEVRRARFVRNRPMLDKDIAAYPDRILQKHFICRDTMMMVQYQLQQNGGQVTGEIKRLCEEVIATYRQHFLGKPHYINTDTLMYYSQALSVLGRGVDVQFGITAGKDQAPQLDGELKRFRFESAEDLEKELTWRARDAVSPFVSAWY